MRKTSSFEKGATAITEPRISVRTMGPREWSITVRHRSTAEDVQSNFRKRGLSCSQIDRDGKEFVFTVNEGRGMLAYPAVQ